MLWMLFLSITKGYSKNTLGMSSWGHKVQNVMNAVSGEHNMVFLEDTKIQWAEHVRYKCNQYDYLATQKSELYIHIESVH